VTERPGAPRRILFVTGKLAEPALRRVLSDMSPSFTYDVSVLGITVAALMTTIRYDNFKTAVGQCPTQKHKTAVYHKVWSLLGDLQPGGPYGVRARMPPAFSTTFADGDEPELGLALSASAVIEGARLNPAGRSGKAPSQR